MAKFCHGCGSPVVPGGRFCGHCGTALGLGAVPQSTVPDSASSAVSQPQVMPPSMVAPDWGTPRSFPTEPEIGHDNVVPVSVVCDAGPTEVARPVPVWSSAVAGSQRSTTSASSADPAGSAGPPRVGIDADRVVPSFARVSGVMANGNLKDAVVASLLGLLPPAIVGLALGVWVTVQGAGLGDLVGMIGLFVGTTLAGSLSIGSASVPMTASTVTALTVFLLVIGMRGLLKRESPTRTSQSVRIVAPVVVLFAFIGATINLLGNMVGVESLLITASVGAAAFRTLVGGLCWATLAAGVAIISMPAEMSVRTRRYRWLLDAGLPAVLLLWLAACLAALLVSVIAVLSQGSDYMITSLISVLLELPTLGLFLLAKGVLCPIDVDSSWPTSGWVGIQYISEEPLWSWLVPAGVLVLGVLSAGFMLLRRSDARWAKTDLVVYLSSLFGLGLLTAASASATSGLEVLSDGVSVSGAVVFLLPVAGAIWWLLTTFAIRKAASMPATLQLASLAQKLPWSVFRAADVADPSRTPNSV